MRLRRAVVTMHHVVDPATVDGGFTRLHRVRAPASLARAGLAGVQASIRRLAGTVIVHEPAFRRVVPEAVVVPHGMEKAHAPERPVARAALGLSDERRLVVLCFGFLAPYKGLEAALAAAAEARDAVRLVVAGAEHPRLAEAGDGYAAGLRERFGAVATFTGHVPDHAVGTMFAAADLALFPYPRPFASSGPLALALAHGTPVLLSPALASCVGAPPALAAPLDPPALAAELRALAAGPERRAALTDAAAALAAGRSWPAVARRHLELYGEVSDAERAAGRRLRAA
jgi:glycosyltransferase involved in cell wall biosynthesis